MDFVAEKELDDDVSPTKSVTFDEAVSFDSIADASTSVAGLATLDEISDEIEQIIQQINRGEDYDEGRLEFLSNLQLEHPEYQAKIAEEYEHWRNSIDEFCKDCTDAMRSFIPVNIFSATYESLVENDGLDSDVARRILQKQCLWLIRMSSAEIARMHGADFIARYSITAQMLDIVEVTAIYASLPEEFLNDTNGKKLEFKESIEITLKEMLKAKECGSLPKGKRRSPVYKTERGPYTDLSTVRYVEAVVATTGPRRSFTETCRQHSILSAFRKKDKKKKKKKQVVDDDDDEEEDALKPAADDS